MNKFSIIIPIFNEKQILYQSITRLYQELLKNGYSHYEIILSENGSTDQTKKIAQKLTEVYSRVKLISLPNPNFGDAFKEGVLTAKFPLVVLFNADWWDTTFLKHALQLLEKYPIVVGSKRLKKGLDQRPLFRRFGSFLLTTLLRYMFMYRGTDSHGLKAFRLKELKEILSKCMSHEIIESELLIRAQRKGLLITEIPVSIKELRPTRISFFRRSFRVTKELVLLKSKF